MSLHLTAWLTTSESNAKYNEYMRLTRAEVKSLCSQRGLSIIGYKDDMALRLVEAEVGVSCESPLTADQAEWQRARGLQAEADEAPSL